LCAWIKSRGKIRFELDRLIEAFLHLKGCALEFLHEEKHKTKSKIMTVFKSEVLVTKTTATIYMPRTGKNCF
jgi:hypothetical protein